MNTDLITRPAEHQPVAGITDGEINTLFRLAKGLAMSGMFDDARQAEQAFAKLILGRDLGLSPTSAMTGIHIVKGKPELSANLQASLLRSTPGYDYRVRELTDDACAIEFFKDSDSLGTERFTMADAQRAGIKSQMYSKFPRNMLFARAMTNGTAFYCPEVTLGIKVYSPGEISGEVVADELLELPDEVADAVLVESSPSGGSEPPNGAAASIPNDLGEQEDSAAAPGEVLTAEQYHTIVELIPQAGAPIADLSVRLTCEPTKAAVNTALKALSPTGAEATISYLQGLIVR